MRAGFSLWVSTCLCLFLLRAFPSTTNLGNQGVRDYPKYLEANTPEIDLKIPGFHPDALNLVNSDNDRYKMAYKSLMQSAQKKERSYAKSLDLLERNYRNKLDVEKAVLEREAYLSKLGDQKRSIAKRSIFITILGLLVGVLIFILYLMFRAGKRVKGMHKEINRLNKRLKNQYVALTRINSNLQKSNEDISCLVGSNNKRIQDRKDRLQEYDSILNGILEKLDELTKMEDNVPISATFGIDKKIRSIMDEKKTWDNFEVYFSEVRPHFVNQIKERAQGLTKTDFKHILYIIAKMSAKEVAVLTNVSVRSVETSRYRLKKRLGLSKSAELLPFLKTL